MGFPRWLQVLCLCALIAPVMGARDATWRFNDLGHRLMCQCGCQQVLLECNHYGCPVSPVMRQELQAAIDSGANDAAVLNTFVVKYGPPVLAAPTTHGFNLVAWIMPFAALVIGLMLAVFFIRRWRGQRAIPAAGADAAHADAPMLERIRRETEY